MNEALLQQLIDAGTPPLLVAKVAAELSMLATKAEAAAEIVEKRRSKDRERKRIPRNSTETAECTETLSPAPSFPPDPLTNPTPIPAEEQLRARKAWPCPEGVQAEHWRDFLANRKTRKLTCSDTAYQGQLRDIAKFATAEWPPGRLVQLAAEKGWGSIVNPLEQKHGQPRQSFSSQPGIGRTMAAGANVLARIHAAGTG